MKRCPVCGSVSFDDMDVCFGCLHEFGGPLGEAGEDDPFEDGLIEDGLIEDGLSNEGMIAGETQEDAAFHPCASGGFAEGVVRIEIPVSAFRVGFAQYVQDNASVQQEAM